ncbi:DUF4625 domain-containing protein [Echinicola shivajiensis]|uniref:DUF4625 domain-containing protein n=1 Tax=Echinicola shivajiensis TaxID=1035916 RepID=UPI001BFCA15B|nr:DUF4625 domain-containing protein [Echinicola shivajiensis]
MMEQKYVCILLILCFGWAMSSCSEDDAQPDLANPQISNIEIGYDNRKEGKVGEDFHFNADIVAGEKIKTLTVQMLQKQDQSYTEEWEYFVEWNEYKGLKNTNVHKHFTIPENAPIGAYDFIFTVVDTNGTHLQLKEDFYIINEETI